MPRTKGAKGKHHKEKPHKEKKQRGRPKGSIKQKQKQNQTVNVKVVNNNGGGGGGGDKKITIPVPFQLPSTIYDPSLVQPHYGINERQPVNPLTDAATDLMTPMIQSMISNQIISRNPPTQGKPTPPIKEKDVTPVNPVITKPPEETIKNPQTDQSHPIKPDDIIMDSNISSSIHDKHQQHKKIKDMIKPQAPPIIKQPKMKDTEGLGANIPIQNVGALATSIATGALTGGATAAGEALITGGFSGLLGAGETIAGAAIGGGISTGVNNVIGGGEVGQIISGIAGGLAGRTAVKKIKARMANGSSEAAPLLGNRLGGRGNGRSNLVPQEEITQTRDPATGEITTWRIPDETQRTMLDKVKKAAKKTMENLSDTVQNIRQQITGRAKKGGTYARIPQEKLDALSTLLQAVTKRIKPQEQYQFDKFLDKERKNASADELYDIVDRGHYDGNDELDIERFLKDSRASYKEKQEAGQFILDKIKLKKGEKGRQILQKVTRDNINQRKKDAKVENITKQILDDSMKEIDKEDAAAAILSGVIKRQKAKKDYTFEKIVYPQMKAKRQEQVKTLQPSTALQAPPPTKTQYTSSLLDQELQASRARAQRLYQEAKQKQPPLPVSSNLQTGTQQTYKNLIKSGDIEKAAKERTMRINVKTMKARQLADDVLVKQLETVKKDAIKKDAAEKLQKAVKRKIAEGNISKIRQAKDKIAGNTKALLTEKADFLYSSKINKAMILNKNTVGQPLALNRQLKLVSKKKQSAAKEGYQNRLAYLDMADKYKDIMKKGKK